jgi:hypothetical protein
MLVPDGQSARTFSEKLHRLRHALQDLASNAQVALLQSASSVRSEHEQPRSPHSTDDGERWVDHLPFAQPEIKLIRAATAPEATEDVHAEAFGFVRLSHGEGH